MSTLLAEGGGTLMTESGQPLRLESFVQTAFTLVEPSSSTRVVLAQSRFNLRKIGLGSVFGAEVVSGDGADPDREFYLREAQ